MLNSTVLPVDKKASMPEAVSLMDLGKQLLECAKHGETEEVRQLMTNGAPFTTDWLGTSPLHMAAQYGHLTTAEVLLRAGISRDARTKVDRTPLHVAAQEGHLEIVELLLKHGADIEAKDMLKMTPLHWAVERGHMPVIHCLLRHDANLNSRSKFDKMPLDIAVDNGREDLMQLLEEYMEQSKVLKSKLPTLISAVDNASQVRVMQECKTLTPVITKVESLPMNSEITGSTISMKTITTSSKGTNGTVVSPSVTQSNKTPATRPLLLHANISNLQRAAVVAAAAALGNNAKIADMDEVDNSDQSSTSVLATLAALAEATAPNAAVSTTEALQWLETHGITMLSSDNSTIAASALEGGQTISLTEAGKLALNLMKDQQLEKPEPVRSEPAILPEHRIQSTIATSPTQKVITIVADQSQLQPILANSQVTPIVVVSSAGLHTQGIGNLGVSDDDDPPRKKLRLPASPSLPSDMKMEIQELSLAESASVDQERELLQRQLEEVKRQAEEYRAQLQLKEHEAEEYRKQLEEIRTTSKQ